MNIRVHPASTREPGQPIARLLVFASVIAVLAAGCASIRTGAHSDDTASFAGYRTFSWIAGDPLIAAAGDEPSVSPLTQRKIASAIREELVRAGFSWTDDRESADFVVAYTVGTRERIDSSSYPAVYRGAWGWHLYGRFYHEVEVVHRMYTEGTLGIDVFDGQSGEPVWHGWASKTISAADRQDPTAAIDKAVAAIIARFPAQPSAD